MGRPRTPEEFRAALAAVPPADRDAWVNAMLGLDATPDADGPDLPRGCVPYMPASVATLLSVAERAEIQPSDVFVDIGAGVGRATALIHLLTGATAIGIEIQAALVQRSHALATALDTTRVRVVHGDAAALTRLMTDGTVFFLYAPFSGSRLEHVIDDLAQIAAARQIRVCLADVPVTPRPWLAPLWIDGGLEVYRSRAIAQTSS